MPGKRATIWEVAELAGVSHQTVSRYLRNDGAGLKPATATKVRTAIDNLNYRPNVIARSMRTRRTGRIALLVPAATANLPLRLMSAAGATAHAAGYTIDIIGLEGPSSGRNDRAQGLAESGEFEGILALASLGPGPLSATTPVVVVADYDDELRGLGALADGAACGEVVERLVEIGHRHLLHIAGPQDHASARNRRTTFVATSDRLGVSGTVVTADWLARSGAAVAMALPADTPVTAIVAANDFLALGAIRAVVSRGWRVPHDVSVFGYDDNEFSRFTTPALSTVAIDRERQGRETMERLLALIRGTEPPVAPETSLHTVILRESIGPAPVRRKRLRVIAG